MCSLSNRYFRSVLVLIAVLFPFIGANASLTSGLRVQQTRETLPGGTQELINLRLDNDGTVRTQGRNSDWSEVIVAAGGDYATNSQGFVDTITGQDGHLYTVFFDDRTFPGYPNHKAVYVRRSTDGGQTWENIDHGATGFALSRLGWRGHAYPSVEVFRTSSTNYRIVVAVYADNQWLTRDAVILLWKDIGSGNNWQEVYIANNQNFDYALPAVKAIPRPSNPSLNRLVIGYANLDYGFYISKYSDTNGQFFGAGEFISDIDAFYLWQPDFVYDSVNSRLFCVWSMSLYSQPNNPRVLVAMSPDRGLTWNFDIYAISPPSWNYCAEAVAAITENPAVPERTLMVAYSARQFASDLFRIEFTYQNLAHISGSGSTWNIAPSGYPVIRGTIYSDTDYDNTMPAITSDNRLASGGYRVALLDQTGPSSARMLYTETDFSIPMIWSEPEEVSAPNADPARQDPVITTGVSSGIAVGTGAYEDTRIVVWPDYRNGIKSDIYCAYNDMSTTPTPTPSPMPTNTPEGTVTPVPPPIPTTSPGGVALLLILVGALILLTNIKRHA